MITRDRVFIGIWIGLIGFVTLLSDFQLSVVSEMLIAGLFAMSLNLMMGYGGMVSFGHAMFYGLGAYSVGILTLRLELSPWLAFLIAPFFSAMVGLIVGWFCVRLVRLYFSILTLAFGQLFYILIFQGGEFTGGDNGLTGIPMLDGITNETQFFILTWTIVGICLWLMWRLVRSPFMLTVRAIRENTDRAEFVGVDVKGHQLKVFVIAAFFAGVAGALIAQHNHLATVDMLFWTNSAEPLLASLLGGMSVFLGPLLGGALLIFLELTISRLTVFWPFVLGLLTIVLVLIAPNGLMSLSPWRKANTDVAER